MSYKIVGEKAIYIISDLGNTVHVKFTSNYLLGRYYCQLDKRSNHLNSCGNLSIKEVSQQLPKSTLESVHKLKIGKILRFACLNFGS